MRVGYIAESTGEINTILNGPLEGMPLPQSGQLAVMTDYAGPLPAYWDGAQVRPMPPQPSTAHVFDWPTKTWLLDLSIAKQQAKARIKRNRDRAEYGPFTWNGHVFDGDEKSRTRMTVALAGAQEALAKGDTAWSKVWKLLDNTTVTLTAADMIEVYRAHGENMELAHSTAAVLNFWIDQANTQAEVDAVVWPLLPS